MRYRHFRKANSAIAKIGKGSRNTIEKRGGIYNNRIIVCKKNDDGWYCLKQCNEATAEDCWMVIENAYHEMKCEMVKAGLPVQHHLDYEDIKQRFSNAKDEILKAVSGFPETDDKANVALMLKTGKEKSAELFPKVVDDVQDKIRSWKEEITDRANTDDARKNEVAQFLLNILGKEKRGI